MNDNLRVQRYSLTVGSPTHKNRSDMYVTFAHLCGVGILHYLCGDFKLSACCDRTELAEVNMSGGTGWLQYTLELCTFMCARL